MTRPDGGSAADAGIRALEELRAAASATAARLAAGAATATTPGCERALLRLLGVEGRDAAGRPLAAAVVDHVADGDPSRLAAGVLPAFALVLEERDLRPAELALAIAAGSADLGPVVESLADPGRAARAAAAADRQLGAALERVGATRTARAELVEFLGGWRAHAVGTRLAAPAARDAIPEAVAAVEAGADAVVVAVPPLAELLEGARRAGIEREPWRPAAGSGSGVGAADGEGRPVPTGSRRAVAALRSALDEAAARRGAYVRLVAAAPELGAPELAAVAATERIDLVIGDPVGEVVAGRADAARALADHRAANRLLARGGVGRIVAAGPLLVAPDLAAGRPSDAATRSGRAFALQLLAVELALADGLAPAAVVVDLLPAWLPGEDGFPALAAAEIALRRALLPGHPAALLEPPGDAPDGRGSPVAWGAVVDALLADAGPAVLVVRGAGDAAGIAASRAAASVAAELAGARDPARLAGRAAEHAAHAIAAARALLGAIEEHGLVGAVDPQPGPGTERLGAGTAIERRGSAAAAP